MNLGCTETTAHTAFHDSYVILKLCFMMGNFPVGYKACQFLLDL